MKSPNRTAGEAGLNAARPRWANPSHTTGWAVDAGGREGGREALRPLRAAMFLDACSSTALFSLRVKAKVQARPYTVWPLPDSLTH